MDKKFEKYIQKFRTNIKDIGLKQSAPRELVLKVLFHSKEHLSAENIAHTIKNEYQKNIGIATVYRVLSLLEENSIIESISINNMNYYEITSSKHHDHMICVKCKKVIEFLNKDIEALQEKVAKKHNFKLTDHNMILYGKCSKCQ